MELFKLFGTIAVDISDADKQLDNIISKAERTSSGFGKAFGKVGDVATKAGQKLLPVTLGIGGIATEAVKVTADFDSAMSQVSAISGATGDDFNALRDKAREMGSKTKFSASEAAEAMNYMAMAGWKTKDMLNGIDGIMNLAAASGESLGTTSDIVTDAMTAFGMAADGTSTVLKDGFEVEVSNATRFADVLAAASSNANTNVSMMGESFKYVAPVAGSLGFSVEDVATALGLMANSGIKASSAGTALRTLFTNMSKPTDQMAAAMDALGVSLDDGEGNMKSLAEVMQDLRAGFGELMIPQEEFTESMNKLDEQLEKNEITQKEYDKEVETLIERAYGAEGAVKAQYAAMLAGKTGMSGLLSIVNATDEDYQKLTDSIYNASGSAEEMATIMQDNLNGQFTILLSQLQELAISFGDMVMPVIRDFTTYIQGLVDKLNQMDDSQREQIIKIGLIVAAAAPLLIVIGKVFSAVGSVITVTKQIFTFGKLLIPLLAQFGAPMLAIIAVIGLLVAAGVNLYKNWDTIKENAINLKNNIVTKFGEMKEGAAKKIDELKQSVSEKYNAILDTMSNTMESAKGYIKGKLDNIESSYESHGGGVKGTVSAYMTAIKEIYSSIFQAIDVLTGGKLSKLWGDVTNKFEDIKTSMSTKMNAAKDSVVGIFDKIKSSISEKINAAKDAVFEAIEKIKSFFNFEWHLPELKLPHIKIDGEWDLKEGKFPSFGVEWYAKAMRSPMIMDKPTAFGINSNGQIMAGGESGSEVVSGTSTLMNMISSAVAQRNAELVDALYKILDALYSLDDNMDGNIREALAGSQLKLNDREFARLVKAVR